MPKQVVRQQLLARPACTPLGAANCEVLEVLLLAGRAPADVPGNGGPPFWSHCGANSDGSGSMHCRRPPALSQSAPPLSAGSQCCVLGSALPPGATAAAPAGRLPRALAAGTGACGLQLPLPCLLSTAWAAGVAWQQDMGHSHSRPHTPGLDLLIG